MSSAKKAKVIGDSSSDEENTNSHKQTVGQTSSHLQPSKADVKPAKTKCIGDVDSDDDNEANQVNFFAEQMKKQIKGKCATVYVAKKSEANKIEINKPQKQTKISKLGDRSSEDEKDNQKQKPVFSSTSSGKGNKIGDSSSSDDDSKNSKGKEKLRLNAVHKNDTHNTNKNQPNTTFKDNKDISHKKGDNDIKSSNLNKHETHQVDSKTTKSKVIGDSSDDEDKSKPQQSQKLPVNQAGMLKSKMAACLGSLSSNMAHNEKTSEHQKQEIKPVEHPQKDKSSKIDSHQKETVGSKPVKSQLIIGEDSSDEEPQKKHEISKKLASKVKKIGDSSSDEETHVPNLQRNAKIMIEKMDDKSKKNLAKNGENADGLIHNKSESSDSDDHLEEEEKDKIKHHIESTKNDDNKK